MNDSEIIKNTGPRKISVLRSIGFGVTDLMGGGYGALVGAYLMFFFTTFCDLSAIKAGLIIGLSKLVDSVTSIVMGKLSDDFWKTKIGAKYGRRRFFLMIGSPLILIVYGLLWIPKLGFWYYLVIYALVEIIVTMIMIPYETLPSEMTTDYNSRSKMSTVRMFFSGSITSVVTLVGGGVISIMGSKNAYAYTVIGVFWAVVFGLAVMCSYLFTWERSVPEIKALLPKKSQEQHTNIFKFLWQAICSYFSTLKVKAFRQHLYLYLLGVTAQDLFSAGFVYFIVFGYNLSTSTASYLLSLGIISLPLTPVNYWIFTRLGAKKAYVLYFACTIVGLLAYWVSWLLNLTGGELTATLIVISTLYLFFKGGAYSVPWNVFPFMPDVDEIVTRQRREGELAAVMTFTRKVTSGIAAVVLGWILSSNGFVSGATKEPMRAVHAIINTEVFVVGILTLVALIIAFTFNLDTHTHKILIDEINRLKAGGKKSDVTPATRKVVESLTGGSYDKKVWPDSN